MILQLLAKMGGGKSILMVYLALLGFFGRGRKVYANFDVGSPPFNFPFDTIGDIRSCGSGLVFIDDIITWFDSRLSSKNYKVSWFYMQSRKVGREEGIDIVYSLQVDTGTDYRLREVTDCVIETFELEFPFFQLSFKDIEGNKVWDDVVVEYGREVYSAYDTYKVIRQKVRFSELVGLFNKCRVGGKVDKNLFVMLSTGKWAFTQDLAKGLFLVLGVDKFDLVVELLDEQGYELEDDRVVEQKVNILDVLSNWMR